MRRTIAQLMYDATRIAHHGFIASVLVEDAMVTKAWKIEFGHKEDSTTYTFDDMSVLRECEGVYEVINTKGQS